MTREQWATILACARIVDALAKPAEHPLNRQLPPLIAAATEALDMARPRHDSAPGLGELMQDDDDMIGSAEVAEMLGTSQRTAQRKALRGELGGEVIGGSWVFRRADIEQGKGELTA